MMKAPKDIVEKLQSARKRSYAPGSRFNVSAVIETAAGQHFVGVNVENASFGLSNCAERSAIFAMVSQLGAQRLKNVWIMAGKAEETQGSSSSAPCGACRQVISEFSDTQTAVHCLDLDGNVVKSYQVPDLLPDAFSFKDFV